MRNIALLIFLAIFPCLSLGKDYGKIYFESSPIKIRFPINGSILLPVYSVLKDNMPTTDDYDLELYILKPNKNKFETIYLGRVGPEGGAANILSVFYHDVDGKSGDELFLLFSHIIIRGDGAGKYYTLQIYSQEKNENGGLKRITDVEEKIGNGFEGISEGVVSHAPYRNAGDVRKLLKNLGY